jgi:HAMP domain-containing protein
MNLRTKVIIVIIGVLFSAVGVNAQGKIKIPKPPRIPKFDFEFGNIFKMKAEEEKKALSKLKTNVKEQLKIVKEYDSNKYYRLLRESQFKNMDFPFASKKSMNNHEREKEIFELEVASEALVAKYQMTNKNSQKNILKTQLKKTLNKLFDLKEEDRKDEVKELEEELKELKKSLRIRMQNKNEIIKRRLQELLNEDDYLEWD